MTLPSHMTRIVATIGPASRDPEVLTRMVRAGLDVARLNFSHGTPDEHAETIERVRAASREANRPVAILADLPGPKMRVGEIPEGPIELSPDDEVRLTTEEVAGTKARMSVSFAELPEVVKPGDRLFLNDGLVELAVGSVEGADVRCRTVVGGEVSSRKGLNLPGIDLGISAFTQEDREHLAFALDHGVDAVSQSFVERASDIEAVRAFCEARSERPFLVAKIERAGALSHLDEILEATDGIMVARGDLGVEIPIEQMAVVQKDVMWQARLRGRPIITATHMLESMVTSRRPTRAEATDVANAILDGTDAVMLSGESAVGRYPVEAVAMLARIAEATEPSQGHHQVRRALERAERYADVDPVDIVSVSVFVALQRVDVAAVFVPTVSGRTARKVARFRLPEWIVAVSPSAATCAGLLFSYGVKPIHVPEPISDWRPFARAWLDEQGVAGSRIVMTEGPSEANPDRGHRMELLDV